MGKVELAKALRTSIAMLVTVALMASACGGASEPSEVTDRSAEAAETTAASAGDASAATPSAIDAEVSQAAARLIGHLGSDEAATDAVLIAMEMGYDYPQIAAAIASDALGADGAIAGVDPAGTAVGLVIGFLQTGDVGPTQIEVFRRQAAEIAEAHEESAITVIGGTGTALVLILLASGLRPDQVVEALLFGVELEVPESEGDLIARCRARDFAPRVGASRCDEVIDFQCRYRARIGGELVVPDRCADLYADEVDAAATDDAAGDADAAGATTGIPAEGAAYTITRSTGQHDTFGREVVSGELVISAVDGQVSANGTVTTEDIFVRSGTDGSIGCTGTSTYTVESTAIDPDVGELLESSFGVDTAPFASIHILVPTSLDSTVFEGPRCDDETFRATGVENAEQPVAEGVLVFLYLIEEGGTLRGSVDYNGISNNLAPAG